MYPVILSGGFGTRLWPLSRKYHPKQLLRLMGKRTMLQMTLDRLDGIAGVQPATIVCNKTHRFLVADQMRELDKQPLGILVEPVARNTAPALTLAALWILEHTNNDPIILAMPADGIGDSKSFQQAMSLGAEFARKGNLVTFGSVPTSPETGYGYIKTGKGLKNGLGMAHNIDEFVEKPNLETATKYIESGKYLWNSGVFMMRASVWLSELEHHSPTIAKTVRSSQASIQRDGHFYYPEVASFSACPTDSIDYAVMEKGTKKPKSASSEAEYVVLNLQTEWTDIGSWSSLWENSDKDLHGNVVQGDVYTDTTKNSLIFSQNRLLATIGLKNVIVVETEDAVLVMNKHNTQEVKEIVSKLESDCRKEQENNTKIHESWGTHQVTSQDKLFSVKRLTVNPITVMDSQVDENSTKHWVIVNGNARITIGKKCFLLQKNESIYVPKGMAHTLENQSKLVLELIEIQSSHI